MCRNYDGQKTLCKYLLVTVLNINTIIYNDFAIIKHMTKCK